MKVLIVSITILLVSLQVFSQKKSDVDPKDEQIATLTKQLDSVSRELVKFTAVYDTLKKKVVHYNFDPAKTALLIDSIAFTRDSASMRLATANADTISGLRKENEKLRAIIQLNSSVVPKSEVILTQKEIELLSAMSTLKHLREMVDANILTEAEFITLKKKYLEKL